MPCFMVQCCIVWIEQIRSTDRLFRYAFTLAGLTQWVTEGTFLQSNSMLDLFLTTEIDRVSKVEVLAPLPNCLHCLVSVEYVFSVGRESGENLLNLNVCLA